MRTGKVQLVSKYVEDGFICSVCKTKYDSDNFFEGQEALHWTQSCGYGSIFGDGNILNLDMCQTCVSRILGVYLEVKEPEYYE